MLLTLLLAAVGCDAARFSSRSSKRVNNRQSSVPKNRDHSSGGMNNGDRTPGDTNNAGGSARTSNGTSGSSQRPNILIFVADDLVSFEHRLR